MLRPLLSHSLHLLSFCRVVFRVLRLSTLHSIPPEAREVKPTGARDERREDEPTEREAG